LASKPPLRRSIWVWWYYTLMPEHVCPTGRAGSGRYGLDIDDCIERAMVMAQQIKEGGCDYPVPVALIGLKRAGGWLAHRPRIANRSRAARNHCELFPARGRWAFWSAGGPRSSYWS
jgi:hypothetical protein